MSDQALEALVGHLFIVGGRTVRTASPGALAMPAPRKPARGRDDDTLFALISLSEEQHHSAAFYEQLTAQVSGTYFSTPGSVTAALRQAISHLNEKLVQLNAQESAPISVGLACAVLRDAEVYVAVAGLARCFFIHNVTVERLPSNADLLDGILPLGEYPEPDMRFSRYEIEPGDFLILSDASLNRLTDTTLRHALSTGDIDVTLNNLATVAGEFSTADVIKFVSPLQDLGVETSEALSKPGTAPPPEPGAAEDRASRLQEAGSSALMGMAKATDNTRTLVENMLPSGDYPLAARLAPGMQVAVAAAVAIIVALMTTFVYRVQGQASDYEQLGREAQNEIVLATAAAGNQSLARPHWENALFLLDEAAALRPASPDIDDLRIEVLGALDRYDYVTRISPQLLREYPQGSDLNGPIIQGLDVYVIDETQDILYRDNLDESGTRLTNREPQIIARRGQLIADQVVSGLIDMAWMEDGGVPVRDVLAVLSRSGLLITYSPSSDVDAFILPGFEAWQDPRAITVYERDLYILDAGANEIWRYQASEDAYASAPQRYFTDIEPDLSDAVDLQIDTNGNVYVLHSDGEISKYFLGREETFTFEGLPQPLARPAALHVNLGLTERAFFIADPGGGRLYTVAPTGTFLRHYRDGSDQLFDSISGVYTLERPPYIYVTAGSRLYYFSRSQ
ncbi:MAG: hypothetical protein ACFB51_09555 [Anaerolineae bacterium]